MKGELPTHNNQRETELIWLRDVLTSALKYLPYLTGRKGRQAVS